MPNLLKFKAVIKHQITFGFFSFSRCLQSLLSTYFHSKLSSYYLSYAMYTHMNRYFFIPTNPIRILDFFSLLAILYFSYGWFFYIIVKYLIMLFVFVTKYVLYFTQIFMMIFLCNSFYNDTYLPKLWNEFLNSI